MPRLLWLVAAVAALACISVPETMAQDSASFLADATTAFEAGKFDEADAIIAKGLEAQPKNHPLLRLRGEIRLARRDFEGALAAYEAYLAAKPRGANRRKARKIIANLAASRSTVLEVNVGSGPVNIYLDSKSIGIYCVAKPVCKKGMLPGRYRIIATREGFRPVTRDVRLRLGKTESVTLALAEMDSSLTVTTVPAAAAVTVDGKPLEKDEAGLVTVAAGPHVVEATLDGFVTATRTVTAARGKPVAVSLALGERVAVTVSVNDATLTLDGAPITLEDGAVVIPSDGNPHALVARADGFRDAEVTLAPDRERGQPVTLTLEKIPDVVKPPEPPEDAAVAAVGWSRNRKIVFGSLVGVSAAAALVGSGIGWGARSKWNEAEDRCPGDFCDAEGIDLIDEARSRATQANVAFGLSVAALIGAGVVYFTAPDDTPEAARVSALVAPGRLGLSVVVGF